MRERGSNHNTTIRKWRTTVLYIDQRKGYTSVDLQVYWLLQKIVMKQIVISFQLEARSPRRLSDEVVISLGFYVSRDLEPHVQ
jgi:hypothetical protein